MSKKNFTLNKITICVLILTALLLLAGCGGTTSTRAKADETVHTALFDFTCGPAEVIDAYNGIDIPEGNKLVKFELTACNTSQETYQIFKDDFQLQWGDGDNDFGVAEDPINSEMMQKDTTLAPGDTVKGLMLIPVPESAATLTVAYQEILESGENGNNFFVDLSL